MRKQYTELRVDGRDTIERKIKRDIQTYRHTDRQKEREKTDRKRNSRTTDLRMQTGRRGTTGVSQE
jgi:hypothetical protein